MGQGHLCGEPDRAARRCELDHQNVKGVASIPGCRRH